MSFKLDHMIRGSIGEPIGRAVLRDDNALKVGEDIQISLFKIPIVFGIEPRGLKVFIDSVPYQVPDNLPNLKLNKRGGDLVVSNFTLKCLKES